MAQRRLPTRCLLAGLGALPMLAGCAGAPARSPALRAATPTPGVAATFGPAATARADAAAAVAPVHSAPAASAAADEAAVAACEDRVAAFAQAERWEEAFAAIPPDTADVRLLALRADLLRDVGRRHEALALWREIVAKVGAQRVDAATLAAIAGLERMEGERDAALGTLAALRARGPADPWVAANDDGLRRQQAELAAGLPIRSVSARDLLGNLRGAPAAADRSRALAAVLATDAGEPATTAALRARAVLIGVGDEDGGVRAAAVAAWQPAGESVAEFCAQALGDVDARVRLAAVPHVRRLAREQSIAQLLDRMAVESDATVFAAMHAAMCAITGAGEVAAPLAGAAPDERLAVVARWRARVGASPQEGGR